MPKVQFDPKISVGHILQFGGVVVVVVAGWMQIKHDLALTDISHRAAIAVNATRIDTQGEIIGTQLVAIHESLTQLRRELKGRERFGGILKP